jgi:hypothetical protein
MRKGSLSRLFPLILVIIIAVLFIAAVVSIGRAIFNSGDNAVVETDAGREALVTVDNSRSVQLTVRGPIVADENFRSYQITVSPSSRDISTYRGYLESIDKSKTLDNNSDAYEQFVYALDKANMMKGVEAEDDEDNDLRGICATGYVYEYSVLQDKEIVKHLWTSTCDGSKGTLRASTSQLNNLFFAQIPGASDIAPFKASSGLRLQF